MSLSEPRQDIISILKGRANQMPPPDGNKTLKIIDCYEMFRADGTELTPSQAAYLTGVSHTISSIIIKFMKGASPEEIADLKAGRISYRQIMTKNRGSSPAGAFPGGGLKVPSEVTSIVDFVSSHLTDENVTVKKLAEATGINKQSVSKIRSLILLRRRTDLSQDDADKLDEALRSIDENKKVVGATRIANGVIARLWYPKSRTGVHSKVKRRPGELRSEIKAKKRLDNTLFAIREACTNNEEMVIPVLSEEQQKEAINIVLESQRALWDLFDKLRRQERDHDDH